MEMPKIEIEHVKVRLYPDGRLDSKSAATYLGLSEKTIAMMRVNGTGPRFIKRGRVFYYREDLDTWLNEGGRITSTAQLRITNTDDLEKPNIQTTPHRAKPHTGGKKK
jgi:hypothetical protein